MREITRQDHSLPCAIEEKPSLDFHRKIHEFTKNLSTEQLILLREHLDNLANETNSTPTPAPPRQQPNLSKREIEVLILLTNGYNRSNIGHSLGISANTAARHIANIYRKLNISSVAEATHYAICHNIIN